MAQALKTGESVVLLKMTTVKPEDPAFAQGARRITQGQIGQVIEPGPGHSFVISFNGLQATVPSRRLHRVSEDGAKAPTQEPGKPNRANATKSKKAAEDPGSALVAGQPARRGRGRPRIVREGVGVPANATAMTAPKAEVSVDTGIDATEGFQQNAPTKLVVSDNELYNALEYNNNRFITAAANKLLINGNDPETPIVLMRLRDLRQDTRSRIEALIQAKLALSPALAVESPTVNVVHTPKRRGPKPKKSS